MVNSNLANDDFIPIVGAVYARDHKREELELAPAPITPHIQNVEEFLVHCRRRKYPSKSTIIYAGDEGDTLSYIIKGSVTVLLEDDDGREMIVAYLNEGDFFGEMGLFGQTDRSAWIRAKTECESVRLAIQNSRSSQKITPNFYLPLVFKWQSDCVIPHAR